MIGDIQIADIRIKWFGYEELGTVHVTIFELKADNSGWNREVINFMPMSSFFKALAIFVHPDGMPNCEADYPDAESVMGIIRWIP